MRPIAMCLALGIAALGCGDDTATAGSGGASTTGTGMGGGTGGTGVGGTNAAGAGVGGSGGAGVGGSTGEPPLSPDFGRVVFNEVLTDGTTEGDPNGDGDSDPDADQFVELLHTGASSFDMSGFTLVERDFPDLPRHTFDQGFSLAPGAAVVVFGGGDAPAPLGATTFFAANAQDPSLQFGLHLSVPYDTIWLLDDEGRTVARFCYGGTGNCALAPATDESLTRSPDETGDFVPHKTAPGSSGAAFSVGAHVDGTVF